jgi:hypothetical protein
MIGGSGYMVPWSSIRCFSVPLVDTYNKEPLPPSSPVHIETTSQTIIFLIFTKIFNGTLLGHLQNYGSRWWSLQKAADFARRNESEVTKDGKDERLRRKVGHTQRERERDQGQDTICANNLEHTRANWNPWPKLEWAPFSRHSNQMMQSLAEETNDLWYWVAQAPAQDLERMEEEVWWQLGDVEELLLPLPKSEPAKGRGQWSTLSWPSLMANSNPDPRMARDSDIIPPELTWHTANAKSEIIS